MPKNINCITIIITLSGVVVHIAGLNGEFGRLKYILARWNKPMKSENRTIINFNTYKYTLNKLGLPFQVFYNFWKLKWHNFVISSQLLLNGVFLLRKNNSYSTYKCSRDSLDSFVVIFFSFTFSMTSKVITIVIQFMFLGKNMFWSLLRDHFNPRLAA